MRILQVLPSYAADWGGPPKVVYQLTEALQQQFEFDIVFTSSANDTLVKIPDGVNPVNLERTRFHKIWKSHSFAMGQFMKEKIGGYDLVHIHEVWLYHLYSAGKVAVKNKIPFIVSPHGELDNWALKYKGKKKEIFTRLFQKNLLNKASAFHALTQKERVEIENYCGPQHPPIHIIPNALPAGKDQANIKTSLFIDEPYLLFLSRINIKKGCDVLLEAYAKWPQKNSYKLVIAGPAEPVGYEKMLRQMAADLQIAERVVFTGAVDGADKKSLYENAALFVLPSLAEGLPVVLLEALQAGCPMLISNNCGIDQLLHDEGLAIVCEPTQSSVLRGLEEFAGFSPGKIQSIKTSGKVVLQKYFSNEIVANAFAELYYQYGKR